VNAAPGEEPLHAAALYGHVDAAKTLLELGATTAVTDKVRRALAALSPRALRPAPAAAARRAAEAATPALPLRAARGAAHAPAARRAAEEENARVLRRSSM
jgi:hypothetical protein